MDYLSKERSIQRRADPKLILPECRSILILGKRYPSINNEITEQENNPKGRIASYAIGRDYHLEMPDMMEQMMQRLQTHLGKNIPYRCYTDTGPILERDLAQRAGLGWIGKNSCLIHPEFGSNILLGEILLGIELESDLPFEADHCGKCTRCIEACPTGCILPDRTLDARHCISYLTIEHKESIPAELSPAIGSNIFGCDICQQVCPWNGKAEKQVKAIEYDVDFEQTPMLAEELNLDSQRYNQKYRNTALLRTRRNRYVRNVIIALANQGYSESNFELLKKFQDDENPLLREQAGIVLEEWR